MLLSSISKDFVKLENTNKYTWYHFSLENDGDDNRRFGVWANGILSETPSRSTLMERFKFPDTQPAKKSGDALKIQCPSKPQKKQLKPAKPPQKQQKQQ